MPLMKRICTSAMVFPLALLFSMSTPALAFASRSGPPEPGDDASQPVAAASNTSVTEDSSSHNSTTNTSGSVEQTEHSRVEIHQKTVAAEVEQHKQNDKPKSAAQHQKQCEAHKQGLTTKFSHIATNSQRIQDRIDGILAKAIAYQQSHNVQAANFDTLVAAAQTAQQTSLDSIAALKTATPTIDCNNTSTASDVAAFKTAAQQTRDNLKAYRSAVKAVLQALEAAKPTSNTTQGGN